MINQIRWMFQIVKKKENFKLNKMVKQTFIKDQIEKKKINNF